MPPIKQITAIAHGDVHGIGFRANTKRNADILGIVGYVKNVEDGTVRVVAVGEEGRLLALLDYLNIGPANSTVEKVDVEWCDMVEKFKEFDIY